MKEQQLVKKQLIKNMVYNLVSFTIIFTIFGAIIYNQLTSSLYQSVDSELTKAKTRILSSLENGKEILGNQNSNSQMNQAPLDVPKENNNMDKTKINPRIIYVLRDATGKVLNENSVGRIYDQYIKNINFATDNLEKIENISFNENYQYRSLTFEIVVDGQAQYIQLLVSVDAENNIIHNFFNILVLGIVVTITLSIIASYLLSKRAIKPIIHSWEKQTEFVQNASHELRTPLTIIQAKQELLLSEPNKKIIEKSEDINLTLKETRRLAKLIKDLMLLARADSNEVQIEKQETNMDAFIQEAVSPYIDFAKMQEKEIVLNLNCPKAIEIDRNRIHQVLLILLDNSIKYTETGDKIEINSYLKEGKCVIEIKDTGIGISEEGLKHIFERFYREDKARSRETGGTGLGLSIAHFITELHGGNIKVNHNQPKGTIITLKLPK